MAYDERDTRVGAMIRHMTHDVNEAFNDMIRDCYSTRGIMTSVGNSCAKWQIQIGKYVVDEELRDALVEMIQFCFERNINLDRSTGWKKIMRIYLPPQYRKKMKEFSQVAQIATMDETPFEKAKKRDVKDVEW